MKEEAEAAVETAKGILQDLVVVVSLVRTLTDSFGSASDLYHKLKRKSHSKDDHDEHEPDARRILLGRRRDSSFDRKRDRHRHISWGTSPRKDDFSDSDEELICKSSSQVRAEYDRGYRKLGEPFARGDLTTQNQLQSQIIQLQQTLLNIQQDLLVSTYVSPTSSHSHLVRLIQTTRTARTASIQALNMQYERMLPLVPIKRPRVVPGPFPLPIDGAHEHHHAIGRRRSKSRRRSNSKSSSSDSSSDSEKKKARPRPTPCPQPLPHGKLFCVYARDLQQNACLPLTDDYKAGGSNLCPFCHSHIATKPGKAWEINVDGCRDDDEHWRSVSRSFLVKNRFVVKCHREHGGFACVLCARFKESDTVCRDIEALMEHLWKDHSSDELQRDEDIVEC